MSMIDDDLAAMAPILGDAWHAEQRATRAEERARMDALRGRLLMAARAAGAVTVTARYEGGNDSGCVDEIYAEPASADEALKTATVETMATVWDDAAKAFVLRPMTASFESAARDVFGWIVTEEHGNWWTGDIESSGEVVWHVAAEPDRIGGEHTVVTRHAETYDWGDAGADDADAGETGPVTGGGAPCAARSEG